MSLFHRHRWQEVGRTYTPPIDSLPKLTNAPAELVEEMTFGITNIEQRCVDCGRVDVVTVVGKVEATA